MGKSPEGKALKFVHRGSYDNMDNTYEAITNHLDDKKLEAKDTFIEEYMTDPLKTEEDNLVINVYVPAEMRTVMQDRILSPSPLLIVAALVAVPAQADVPPPAISVTGEATISAPPDLAQIEAGVTTEAKTAREASDANNAAMGKVLLALKGAGIDEKDYQTSRLSLQPEMRLPRFQQQRAADRRLSRQQPRHRQTA